MNKEKKQTVSQLLDEKGLYVSPWCEVLEVEEEKFLCTTAAPGRDGSTEDEWGNDEDIDGDTDLDL